VKGWKVIDALNAVRPQVPHKVAGDILNSLAAGKLDDVRDKFCAYNMSVMKQFAGKSHSYESAGSDFEVLSDSPALGRTVNLTSGALYGIRDPVAEVITNPMFTAIIKNIVNGVFEARAIPTVNSLPGCAQNDVRDIIGAIVTNPIFAQVIADLNTFFSGVDPLAAASS
jgi:hypothetical protein